MCPTRHGETLGRSSAEAPITSCVPRGTESLLGGPRLLQQSLILRKGCPVWIAEFSRHRVVRYVFSQGPHLLEDGFVEWAGVVPLLPLNLDFNEDAVDVLPVAPAVVSGHEFDHVPLHELGRFGGLSPRSCRGRHLGHGIGTAPPIPRAHDRNKKSNTTNIHAMTNISKT